MNISGGQIKMVTCNGFIEPLNLECWILNVFSGGSAMIFLFVAVIIIAMVAARFRMKNEVAALMLAVFGILFGVYLPGIMVLIILLGGLFAFTIMKRLVTQQ